jgi:hypothetical protein
MCTEKTPIMASTASGIRAGWRHAEVTRTKAGTARP